ncbi:rho GTPase-activating protein Graf-like isoform X2 [Vanessa cardui]|uniref:rho GTPase-activating protein Graf-like isoform X2 n=1 Tax=Vanessa cardui TaxID=171605 RepID=UPI001F135634|nr:rho GTPase-activating protein Graf-like isoform X2 [Vanessa cardui]
MGVGLQPLEFTECLADSPHFRENLQRHEKELERTSQQIKRLIKEVKDVVQAAKRLGAAQLALAASMEQFEFACIGASMTEDERVIGRSLQHFAQLIRTIEDERDRMLGRAHEQIIQPLERFRKDHIGAVKEGKKKFDKKTAKFCQSQERTLSLSTKKPENVFQEADAAMDMAERDFCQASLEYVFQLQAVQERKKFELVETLLGFVFGWWTFHHTAHDVHADAEPLVRDLQLRIQRTRSNFEETSKQTESLMKKMMEVRQMNKEDERMEDGSGGVSGYLFLMEKKAFGTTWSKQYCSYEKGSRTLSLMPYNQINVKTAGGAERVALAGARAAADAERRFCLDALPAERERAPLTLQAPGPRQRAAWLAALDAQPAHVSSAPALGGAGVGGDGEAWALDDAGFAFVRRVIGVLEARGLEEQGLYRVAGVASKVSRLVALARERRLPAALADPLEWESKTLTSALKAYLRALPEPLLTRKLHRAFLAAAKCERRSERVSALHALVHALPQPNYEMLRLVLAHLTKVVARSDRNLMTASNLAVCFGPTLLRAERETVASILELKFYNVLVESLLDNFGPVFALEPPPAPAPAPPPAPAPAPAAAPAPPHALNGVIGTSPPTIPLASRNDISVSLAGALAGGSYSPHHHQLLQHFTPPGPRAGRCSSSSESVSSHSASPPPRAPLAFPPRTTRVRTLYACLGESEGELSFEPNQIITNVSPSAEPGWLRGTLNGKSGLVPQNYVEPLP